MAEPEGPKNLGQEPCANKVTGMGKAMPKRRLVLHDSAYASHEDASARVNTKPHPPSETEQGGLEIAHLITTVDAVAQLSARRREGKIWEAYQCTFCSLEPSNDAPIWFASSRLDLAFPSWSQRRVILPSDHRGFFHLGNGHTLISPVFSEVLVGWMW